MAGHVGNLVAALRQLTAEDPVDQHDLGGLDTPQVGELVAATFGAPLPCPDPVKITFVVGAGKKQRGKYSPSLPKDLIASLADLGFEEDRGASACLECCGHYKYQHDTDKDLKFLHVFPHVTPDTDDYDEADEEDVASDDPAEICRRCTLAELKGHAPTHIKKFSQKRMLLVTLKAQVKEMGEFEARMMEAPLTEAEDERYSSSVDLEDKVAWVNGEMERMMADGKLTAGELRLVSQQFGERMEKLQGELEKATAAGKDKKAAKLEEFLAEIKGKRAALQELTPIVHAVKHDKRIRQLRRELREIGKLEASKGLMDVAALKKIGQKDEVEAELDELMQDNIGWFETQASLNDMVATLDKAGGKGGSKKAKGGGGDGFTQAKRGGRGKVGRAKPAKSSNPFDLLN